jgi:hypothetical protein
MENKCRHKKRSSRVKNKDTKEHTRTDEKTSQPKTNMARQQKRATQEYGHAMSSHAMLQQQQSRKEKHDTIHTPDWRDR